MKLVNDELNDDIWRDINTKILKHAPYGNDVREQIEKNFGWWDDDSSNRLELFIIRSSIQDDLDETS